MVTVKLADQTRRRLMQDFKRLRRDHPPGVNGAPEDGDLQTWSAVIFGPEDTVWQDGIFKLSLAFPEDYPSRPPTVKFTTPIFHPNVYMNGDICLDILQNQWTPTYDTSGILTSIRSLLADPNPQSPANSESARLFLENRREYNRRVQRCVEESLKILSAPNEKTTAVDNEKSTSTSSNPPASNDSTQQPQQQPQQQSQQDQSTPETSVQNNNDGRQDDRTSQQHSIPHPVADGTPTAAAAADNGESNPLQDENLTHQ